MREAAKNRELIGQTVSFTKKSPTHRARDRLYRSGSMYRDGSKRDLSSKAPLRKTHSGRSPGSQRMNVPRLPTQGSDGEPEG